MQALLADDPGFIRDSFWPDGMVRVSGREYNGLIESPCFVKATDPSRTLSCFSCHTMHKTPAIRGRERSGPTISSAPGMGGNEACTAVPRSRSRANVTAHTNHAGGSTGSSCYNCHMPYTTYGLLKTIRSHTVSSPSVAESVETGPAERLQPLPSRQDAAVDRRRARRAGTAQPAATLTADRGADLGDRLDGRSRATPVSGRFGAGDPVAAGQQASGHRLDGAVPGAAARRLLRRGPLHRRPDVEGAARLRPDRLRLRGWSAGAPPAAAAGDAPLGRSTRRDRGRRRGLRCCSRRTAR